MDGQLRQLHRAYLPKPFWTSVETGATSRGVPDSFVAYDGRCWWIEFKATAHWRVGMRPEQIGWHLRYARTGNVSFIAVRRKRLKFDELWIINGRVADNLTSLQTVPLSEVLYKGDDGPAKWDWEEYLHRMWWTVSTNSSYHNSTRR